MTRKEQAVLGLGVGICMIVVGRSLAGGSAARLGLSPRDLTLLLGAASLTAAALHASR